MTTTEPNRTNRRDRAMSAVRALVCEDDPGARKVIGSLLAQHAVDVIAEVDMLSHLPRLVRYGHPDLVILDLLLVGTSTAAAALDDLASIADTTAVVVFSAHDSLRQEALARGAYAFVDKPRFDRLAEVVAGLAGRSGRQAD